MLKQLCWTSVREGQVGSWDFYRLPEVMRYPSSLCPCPHVLRWYQKRPSGKSGLSLSPIGNDTTLPHLLSVSGDRMGAGTSTFVQQQRGAPFKYLWRLSGEPGLYLHLAVPTITLLEWYQREQTKTGSLNKIQSLRT